MNSITFSGKDFVEKALDLDDKIMCVDCVHCLSGERLNLSDPQKRLHQIVNKGQCAKDTDRLVFSLVGKGTHPTTLCGSRYYQKRTNQLAIHF
jgi:hypothetical protein